MNYSDYYTKVNGKLGPAYKHFIGTLTVVKEKQVGAIDTVNRGITVWGIKAKAKKEIRIEHLYEDTFGDEDRNV
jgi:hypothetical protein